MKKTSTLTLWMLTLLIVGSIDSIRNLPTTALFGSTLIFFFIFSAIVFLIPAALVSAELSSTWTRKGGIYHWVEMAFGEKWGFIAIWLQWINTMVWYPTILSFIAGTLAYLINPHLADNKIYLISIILGTFWIQTIVNLNGLKTSAKFASFCAVVGMLIPMALIISLAIAWIALGHPIQIELNSHTLLPHFGKSSSWISLTAIMTAFLGMELATVHVREVREPQKTFPKAMLLSVLLILSTMILGSLAIAFVLPSKSINLVAGIMQAFKAFFIAFHMGWLLPVITIMLIIGSLGGMVNWIISPAKGLLQAAEKGFLPHYLQKYNKHNVPGRVLILQAILVTFICFAFLFMPSVNGSYWLLTDLSTQLYMIMYVLMFSAALVLGFKYIDTHRPFKIPGGKFGRTLVCIIGVLGSLVTITVGFFPPHNIDVGSPLHYEMMFCGGMLLMMIPAGILMVLRKK